MSFKKYDWVPYGLKIWRKSCLYEQQMEVYRKQTEEQRSYDLKMRRLQHDMKSHMIALLGMVQVKDTEGAVSYIRSLLDDGIEHGEKVVHCGNIVVDSLVNYRAVLAGREGISFDADIFLPSDIPFQSRHLVIVFGNLLENAMEACCEIKDGKRYIKVEASYVKEVLMVRVRNSCEGRRSRNRDGHFGTTKRDKWNHGLGLSSVEQTAELYHGQVETECADGSFQAVVIMYS